MGQIHQYLVLFNYVALSHEALFSSTSLTFATISSSPRKAGGRRFKTSQEPEASTDLKQQASG